MSGFCLTAGPALSDILWSASILPVLRRAQPHAHLAWECPMSALHGWLGQYPELDEVVGDVEEMMPPPETYLILHPLWHPDRPCSDSAVAGLFALVEPWCSLPSALPRLPYCPLTIQELPPLADLPSDYVCLDPYPGEGLPVGEGMPPDWSALVGQLPLPTVQVGSEEVTGLPGAIDARGGTTIELARAIRHGRLFIGADSASSCLASSLQVPQIWVEAVGNGWWWPRCSCCRAESVRGPEGGLALATLARTKLERPHVS